MRIVASVLVILSISCSTWGCGRPGAVEAPPLARAIPLEPRAEPIPSPASPPPPAPSASTSNRAAVTPAMLREAAAAWLVALAADDQPSLVRASSPELVVTGFKLATGPERSRCGKDTDRLAELALRAADIGGIERAADCILQDRTLVHTVPHYRLREWPETRSSSDRWRRIGYLKPLDLQAHEPRLQRYRVVLSALPADSVPFAFFVDDQNGSSIHGAIVVRNVEGEPRVVSVFIDEKFEE